MVLIVLCDDSGRDVCALGSHGDDHVGWGWTWGMPVWNDDSDGAYLS